MVIQLAIIDGAVLALDDSGRLYRSYNAPHCHNPSAVTWEEISSPAKGFVSGEIRRAS